MGKMVNTTKKTGTYKKAKKRRDKYGNELWPGEYYSEKRDCYEYRFVDVCGDRRSKGAKTLDDLRTLEDSIRAEINDKLIHGSKNITVNRLIDIYLKSKRKIEKTTLTGYWYNFERYIKPSWFGNMEIDDVLKVHVSNFYNDLIEEMDLSKSTIELINNFVSPSFRLAIDSRWINHNPCTYVMKEVIETEKIEKVALSRTQQAKFLDHVQRFFPGYYNYIFISLHFGLRIGETLGMTLDELCFETKKFNLTHQLIYKKLYNENKTKFMIHKPKTKNGIRYMYFYDKEVEQCLCAQIDYAKYIYDTVGNKEIDGHKNFIFVTSTGLPYTPNSINRTLERMIETYNKRETAVAKKEKREPEYLPHISSHSLRHTGLTRMAESGMAPQTLQFIAGHSNIEITLQFYVKTSGEQVEEDMQKYIHFLKEKVV